MSDGGVNKGEVATSNMSNVVQWKHKSKLKHWENINVFTDDVYMTPRGSLQNSVTCSSALGFFSPPKETSRQTQLRTACTCLLTTLNIWHICTHTCTYAHIPPKGLCSDFLTPWWRRSTKARVSAEGHLETDIPLFTLCRFFLILSKFTQLFLFNRHLIAKPFVVWLQGQVNWHLNVNDKPGIKLTFFEK